MKNTTYLLPLDEIDQVFTNYEFDRTNEISVFYAQHMVNALNQATRGQIMEMATNIIKMSERI